MKKCIIGISLKYFWGKSCFYYFFCPHNIITLCPQILGITDESWRFCCVSVVGWRRRKIFFSVSRTQKTRERDFHRCLDKRRGKHGDKRGGRPTQAHTFAQKKINIANARSWFFFARELQDSGNSSFFVNFFCLTKKSEIVGGGGGDYFSASLRTRRHTSVCHMTTSRGEKVCFVF